MTKHLAGLLSAALSLFVFDGAFADTPPNRLAEVEAYVTDRLRASSVPGAAVGIVQRDRTVKAWALGIADGSGRPVSADTPFILGSTSKSFTALAIMQLAEAGKVDLDAPAGTYLPGFLGGDKQAEQITIRHLLNQTSGLSHESGDQPVVNAGGSGRDAIRHWALSLSAGDLNRAVGASYEYSNANYVVLGAVVERASGELYPEYVRRHIFTPLGMTRSYASLAEGEANGLAGGHVQFFGRFIESDVPYPASFIPGGFLISTANDMTRYLSMLANHGEHHGQRLLSAQGVSELHRGAANMDPHGKSRYAMGWVADTFNGVPVVYHDGDTGRFSAIMAIARESGWGVVVLANGSGWLHSPHMIEAASGAINLLSGRTPKDYGDVRGLSLGVYLALVLTPLLQGLFFLWSFAHRERSLLLGTLLPFALNAGLAAGFVYVVPRGLFGIPPIEALISLPDIGAASLVSALIAVGWAMSALTRGRGGGAT
jgi:CubicO group peptidase (beta-lactamase class C family)